MLRMCYGNVGVIFMKNIVENFVQIKKKFVSFEKKSILEKMKANLVSRTWGNLWDSVSIKYCRNAGIIFWRKNYEKVI